MAARISREGLLVIDTGTPKVRPSREGLFAIVKGTPKVRDSQLGLLVITQTNSSPANFIGGLGSGSSNYVC
jgi:hypothetical protein